MNACFWDSDSVIFDRNKDFAILSVVSIVIVELSGLNLIALLRRLYKTCWICSMSACASSSLPDRISSRRILRLVQEPSKEAAVALITPLISKAECSAYVLNIEFVESQKPAGSFPDALFRRR